MFEVKARKVVRRGRAHDQRCEDDSLVFSYNQISVIAVFDGCSDGTDSYFASGLFAKILKKIAIEEENFFKQINEETSLEDIVNVIMCSFFYELKKAKYYLKLDDSEILSTIVLSAINLKTKQSFSIIIGDGSVYVDGEINTIQPEKNAPRYIAYFLGKKYEDFWSDDVNKYKAKVKDTIAVMSDGIDSFRHYSENRYVNETEKADIIHRFFKSGYLLDNKVGLARICNILDSEHFAPSDDLSIAHITFIEIPEQDETI